MHGSLRIEERAINNAHEAPRDGRRGLHRLRRRQASCCEPATRSPSSTISRAGTAPRSRDGARFIEVGLPTPRRTRDALAEGFDGVLHFAALALVAESVEFPERYHRGNFVGTLNLLDAMREHGVARLVFSSTCATYGEPEQVPMPEDVPTDAGQLLRRLQARRRPDDRRRVPRARARRDLAALLQRRGRERRARRGPRARDAPDPARPAGRRRHARAHQGVRHRLPDRDGTAVRDYIHVEDLGRAHLLALDAIQPGRHAIYNLGNGDGYSVREVIDAARARDRPRDPRQGGAAPPRRPAAARGRQREGPRAELGWEPRARPRDDDRRRVGLATRRTRTATARATAPRADRLAGCA